MQSTIQLFEHLCRSIPPLFPAETKQRMDHALQHLKNDQTVSLDEVEHTMIAFGYEVWPWNQAYRECLAVAENHIGEHFLLPKLSKKLHDKYLDFKKYGGTFRELHSGHPAEFFTIDERTELCTALVDLQHDLRGYVNRDLQALGEKKYLERVNEFKKLLNNIRQTLEQLRLLADKEQDHPTLAHEIRARVEHFEHGLCLLGPELDYEAVCQSVDFFHGRKKELSRLRGIHVPVQINF